MTLDRGAIEHWEDGVRGLMLGLALGESIGLGAPAGGVIKSGLSAQLAAFTTEGLIRAMMRLSHKGICSPPDVIWRAYRRWAQGQGIKIAPIAWDAMAHEGSDGWLREVPVLKQRRGSSPSTVAALKSGLPGTPERPTSQSMGCQGLTRVLPLAVLAPEGDASQAIQLARQVTALTHGNAVGLGYTAAAVCVAIDCIRHDDAQEGLHEGANAANDLGLPTWQSNETQAVLGLDYMEGSLRHLREIAPDKSARSALLGGMYVASTYPHVHQFVEAMTFAAAAPDGDSVGAVAGALLGASHGASQLPVDLVSRHELGWVLDTLARDSVLELTDSPGGSEYSPPRDGSWWSRYPGW